MFVLVKGGVSGRGEAGRCGFTIVELVIVIAVIAILAAVLMPTFSGMITRANESAALQEARNSFMMMYGESTGGALPERNEDGTYRAVALVASGKSGVYAFGCNGGELDSVELDSLADSIESGKMRSVLFNSGAIKENGYSVCAQRPDDWDAMYEYYYYAAEEGGKTVYKNFTGETAPTFSDVVMLDIVIEEGAAKCLASLFEDEVKIYKNASGYLLRSGSVTLRAVPTRSVSEGGVVFSDSADGIAASSGHGRTETPSSPGPSQAEQSSPPQTSQTEGSSDAAEESSEPPGPAVTTGTLSAADGFAYAIQFDNISSTDWTFPLGEELVFSVHGEDIDEDYTITMGGVPLAEGAGYTKDVLFETGRFGEKIINTVTFTVSDPTGDIVIDHAG